MRHQNNEGIICKYSEHAQDELEKATSFLFIDY